MMMKIHFRIHPAGAAVFAAAFLLMDSHEILAYATAMLAHESGHLAAMALCGMKECFIEFTPFGGMVDVPSFDMYSPIKKAAAAMSGVLVSAGLAFGVHLLQTTNLFLDAFFRANLSLAALNVLPAWPLDGARTLAALSCVFGFENTIRKVLIFVSRATGVMLVLLGLYGVWMGMVNLSLLIIGPYLCYAAGAENVCDKVKKLNSISGKMHYRNLLPVSIKATGTDSKKELQNIFLKQLQYGRYLLLLQIDPSNGKIRKTWTENELMDDLLEAGMNCRMGNVDKTNGL